MNILIGTKNAYKAGEMTSFIKDIPNLDIHLLKDADFEIEVEENQDTLIGNAEKKAIEISQHTDWYVLASDNGVDIPGMGEKWDILRNQRIVGEKNTDIVKVNKLLKLAEGLKGDERKAFNRLALALAQNGKILWSSEQVTDEGYIAEELVDEDIPEYMWMGHVWYYPQYKTIFNKLTNEQKEELREQAEEIKTELRKELEKINAGDK